MDTEVIAMTLIAHSGDARTMAFQALQAAKKLDFAEAERLMQESKKAAVKAHNAQTELLAAEANGEKPEVNVVEGFKNWCICFFCGRKYTWCVGCRMRPSHSGKTAYAAN